jgi:hypothetical protein
MSLAVTWLPCLQMQQQHWCMGSTNSSSSSRTHQLKCSIYSKHKGFIVLFILGAPGCRDQCMQLFSSGTAVQCCHRGSPAVGRSSRSSTSSNGPRVNIQSVHPSNTGFQVAFACARQKRPGPSKRQAFRDVERPVADAQVSRNVWQITRCVDIVCWDVGQGCLQVKADVDAGLNQAGDI